MLRSSTPFNNSNQHHVTAPSCTDLRSFSTRDRASFRLASVTQCHQQPTTRPRCSILPFDTGRYYSVQVSVEFTVTIQSHCAHSLLYVPLTLADTPAHTVSSRHATSSPPSQPEHTFTSKLAVLTPPAQASRSKQLAPVGPHSNITLPSVPHPSPAVAPCQLPPRLVSPTTNRARSEQSCLWPIEALTEPSLRAPSRSNTTRRYTWSRTHAQTRAVLSVPPFEPYVKGPSFSLALRSRPSPTTNPPIHHPYLTTDARRRVFRYSTTLPSTYLSPHRYAPPAPASCLVGAAI